MTVREQVAKFFFGDLMKREFSSTPLADAMAYETYGTETVPYVSKEEALSVPGIMRARNTICSIATLPLKAYDEKWELVDNPLLRQIDPFRTNVVVLADTLEDLWLNKYAYWHVTARNSKGRPTKAEFIDKRLVSDPTVPGFQGEEQDKLNDTIRINGKVVPWSDIIRFESPNPAFLETAGRVSRLAIDLDVTAAKYAKNPRPLDYFTTADPTLPDPDAETVKSFLGQWKQWLKKEVTAFVPGSLKYVVVEQPTPQELQLIEAQRQVQLSIANMTGLDPEDLGINTTSRTYFNADDRRQTKINDMFAPYMRAIADRLSMADVTPRGQTVQFDLTDYMKADDKTRADVQIAYKGAGLLTADEIRADERRPALPANTVREASNGDS